MKPRPSNLLRISLFTLLAVACAFAASSAIAPGDPDSGIWELSKTQDCPDGLICVEWTYTVLGDEVADEACCMDPSYLGSTQYHFCSYGFRHEPH